MADLRIWAPMALLALVPVEGQAAGFTSSSTSAEYSRAESAVKAGRYRDAIPLLKLVIEEDPNDADAYNYLGYSHRKLGEYQTALEHYRKALSINPNHRGANEYLGELYLEMNNLPMAEDRLQVLSRICFLGCEELNELKAAVDAYKKKKS